MRSGILSSLVVKLLTAAVLGNAATWPGTSAASDQSDTAIILQLIATYDRKVASHVGRKINIRLSGQWHSIDLDGQLLRDWSGDRGLYSNS